MTDTLTHVGGVTTDTGTPRYRLTREAANQAMLTLGLRRLEDLAPHLGISRSSLFRLLDGGYSISLARAARFADSIDWPISAAFVRCDP
jgi:DNA-binding IclR family transcriptional regulator